MKTLYGYSEMLEEYQNAILGANTTPIRPKSCFIRSYNNPPGTGEPRTEQTPDSGDPSSQIPAEG